TGWIREAAASGIREPQIAVGRACDVTQAAKALGVHAFAHGRNGAASGIEARQPVPVVGDGERSIRQAREAMGLTVALVRERPSAASINAEYASIRNVDAPEVAVSVVRRSFEKRMELLPRTRHAHPLVRLAAVMERRRQGGEHF